jgi:hypothetical protein
VDSGTQVGARPRELIAGALALTIGIAVLPAVGGSVLWTHPLWLDELCCTLYPVEHASTPVEVVTNLARPHDYAPPLLHLIVWTVGRVAGEMTPTLLRWIALVAVSLASMLVYATLRRRFPVAPSAAGALAVAAHPLVITHAFEGRFYGPWILLAAAWAWAAGRRDRTGAVLQGVFAIGVVTIHWFGVISLAIMAAGVLLSFAPRWRDGLRAVAPSAAGVAALLACLPLLFRQMAGSSAYAWIPPLSGEQIIGLARVFFLVAVPALAAALVIVEMARAGRSGPRAVAARITDALRQPGVAALGALCVFPVALMLLSTIQPVMLDRYAITTVLFWAPLVALAVEPLPRAVHAVALVALALQFKPSVDVSIAARRSFADQVAADSASFERVRTLGMPVAFPWLHALYPVVGPRRGEATSARFLDAPDTALDSLYPGDGLAWFRNRIRVEAASARSHRTIYGFPSVVTRAELDTVQRFALMTSDLRIRGGARQAEIWAGVVFPNHTVHRLDDRVSILERKTAAPRGAIR